MAAVTGEAAGLTASGVAVVLSRECEDSSMCLDDAIPVQGFAHAPGCARSSRPNASSGIHRARVVTPAHFIVEVGMLFSPIRIAAVHRYAYGLAIGAALVVATS